MKPERRPTISEKSADEALDSLMPGAQGPWVEDIWAVAQAAAEIAIDKYKAQQRWKAKKALNEEKAGL